MRRTRLILALSEEVESLPQSHKEEVRKMALDPNHRTL
jgi:hypothetical protein